MNVLEEHGIDTEKYSVFYVLNQTKTNLILHITVQSNKNLTKIIQKQKVITIGNTWDDYLSAVASMAKECIKELEK